MKQDTITDPPEVKSVTSEYCKKFIHIYLTTYTGLLS